MLCKQVLRNLVDVLLPQGSERRFLVRKLIKKDQPPNPATGQVFDDVYWLSLIRHSSIGELQRNKVCLFAHYDSDGLIEDYVVKYLKDIEAAGFDTIFVTTAEQMDPAELEKISNYTIGSVIRENIGYDFGSWRTGSIFIRNDKSIDSVLIANDSVYGSLFPLEPIFEKMEKRTCDVWGATDNFEIRHHIQSYFICFKGKTIQSGHFQAFMDTIEVLPVKQDIIDNYEVGLSDYFKARGYKLDAFCPYESLEALDSEFDIKKRVPGKYHRVNSTLFFWDILISQFKYPFIKIELLRDNPYSANIDNWQKYFDGRTDFPVAFIEQHLKKLKGRKI